MNNSNDFWDKFLEASKDADWSCVARALKVLKEGFKAKMTVEDEPEVCYECGSTEELFYGPDPYREEISDDKTPVYQCGKCRRQAIEEI